MANEILLQAKLYRPPSRAGAVQRPRLTARLDELLDAGLSIPLGLVSAPPGFGKTSLMAEWIERCGVQAAWLSLDAGDNDPARFLTYLIAAIRKAAGVEVGQEASALLSMVPTLAVESVLAALLNDLGHLDAPLVVALDDYQAIESQAVQQAVRFLIEHLPPNAHLLVATRADPPLPLARLRARGQLVEIRANDLRFTGAETAAFLVQTAGIAADADKDKNSLAAVLSERTEGWAAGLQMAALSLAGRAGQPGGREGFLREFSGSHRYVLDYLTEEVLTHLPGETVIFLLQSAILERLSASLCAAVLAGTLAWTPNEVQNRLEDLERANLFLVPLDDSRTWYRYHHLFADLLRARLKQQHPQQIAGLHARAADWYAAQNQPAEAVGHRLAAAKTAGEGSAANAHYEAAAGLIEAGAMDLFLRGETATFFGWVDALPPGVVTEHPLLDLYRAAAYGLRGDGETSERITAQVQARLEAKPGGSQHPPGLQAVANYLAGIQVVQLDMQDRTDEVVRLAERTLPDPGLDLINRVTLLFSLGHARFLQGDVKAALEAWSEAERWIDPQRNPYGLALATAHQARAERLLGRLAEAQARLERGLAQLSELEAAEAMGLSVVEIGLGDLLRERGVLVEAREMIESARHHPTRFSGMNGQVLTAAALARLDLAEGDPVSALARFDRMAAHLPQAGIYPEYREEAEAARALAWLAAGELGQAAAWAESITMDVHGLRGELARLTAARVGLALGNAEWAAAALEDLASAAAAAGRWSRAVEALAVLAAARYQQDDTAGALEALGRALAIAAPRGHVRSVLEAGVGISEVLVAGLLGLGIRQDVWSPVEEDYAKALLAQAQSAGEGDAPILYGERLSEREIEVLALVAEGLSNAEIAARLVITTGTVRAHTANIYRKLDVASRTQAAARARELGILSGKA